MRLRLHCSHTFPALERYVIDEMGLKTFDSPATLLQLLQQAATDHPNNGQIFLDNGIDGPETSLKYGDLLEKATVGLQELYSNIALAWC